MMTILMVLDAVPVLLNDYAFLKKTFPFIIGTCRRDRGRATLHSSIGGHSLRNFFND